MKPTPAQLRVMKACHLIGGGYYPGPKNASATRGCVRKGLMYQREQYGAYCLTDAGRAALEQGGQS